MMERSLRRTRFLTTAFPTWRLIAYATCNPDQEFCCTYVTDSGPDRPRNELCRKAANVWRDRIGPTPLAARRTVGSPSVTRTGGGVPSPGATESPLVQPWSTSACGSRVSWPACARSADRSVSSIHFLPRPEPGTLVSRSAGGPVTRIRAFPYMVGAKPPAALVDGREARQVGTVYRSEHSRRLRRAQHLRPDAVPAVNERRRMTRRNSARPRHADRCADRSVLVHSCGYLCGPIAQSKGGGPCERH